MNKENKSILIIDYCPLICEAYKSIIKSINRADKFTININVTHTAKDGFEVINEFVKNNSSLDLVILDLKLPPCNTNKLVSGEDLGLIIRELLPNTKIIIATKSNDNYIVHGVFKSINPEGFILKKDLTSKEFKRALYSILDDTPYYSKSILKLLRKEISSTIFIDNTDRKILYELSIGSRMKDLTSQIPLSAAGIEKRKRHLKKVFNVKEKGDRELIIKAKEKGFI